MSFPNPNLNLPRTFQCTQCGWKITIPTLQSDVLPNPSDYIHPGACLKCGGQLESHTTDLLQDPPPIHIELLTKVLGKIFGKQ